MDTIKVGALGIRFLVEPDGPDASVSVFECSVPADAKVPAAHSHDAFEETIYGLEGEATFTVDGKARQIGPGDAVYIPRGAIHGFENHGGTAARFLAISTPGVMKPEYFREMHEVIAAADGPPDPAEIRAVMLRHGLTPAPPTPIN
jgi:quercetin dioxygenase-like cupin family protein